MICSDRTSPASSSCKTPFSASGRRNEGDHTRSMLTIAAYAAMCLAWPRSIWITYSAFWMCLDTVRHGSLMNMRDPVQQHIREQDSLRINRHVHELRTLRRQFFFLLSITFYCNFSSIHYNAWNNEAQWQDICHFSVNSNVFNHLYWWTFSRFHSAARHTREA